LIGADGEGETQVAHVTSTSTAPLQLEAGSEALGLRVHLEGEQSCDCHLDFLLAQGVIARQQGEVQVRARSEMMLALPEGPEEFLAQVDMRIHFDLRLTEVR
jgi:hypothetical protein